MCVVVRRVLSTDDPLPAILRARQTPTMRRTTVHAVAVPCGPGRPVVHDLERLIEIACSVGAVRLLRARRWAVAARRPELHDRELVRWERWLRARVADRMP